MATNRRIVKKEGADFYPTPSWATQALIDYSGVVFDPYDTYLEPCCGDGAISKVLENHVVSNSDLDRQGIVVDSYDLYDRGYGKVKSVFDQTHHYGHIITNPPFNIATEIIEHCLPLADYTLCFLLRTSFLESANRHDRIFSITPPSVVLVFSERLSMYPAGQNKESGGTTSYSWFIWEKYSTKAPEIKWIPPGLKPNGRKKSNGKI